MAKWNNWMPWTFTEGLLCTTYCVCWLMIWVEWCQRWCWRGDNIWVDGYGGGCFNGDEVKDRDKVGQVFRGLWMKSAENCCSVAMSKPSLGTCRHCQPVRSTQLVRKKKKRGSQEPVLRTCPPLLLPFTATDLLCPKQARSLSFLISRRGMWPVTRQQLSVAVGSGGRDEMGRAAAEPAAMWLSNPRENLRPEWGLPIA